MLGEKMEKHKVNVWLVNTGWVGGKYGVGKRIDIQYTRSLITAALNGSLDKVEYEKSSIFKTLIPTTCPDVPSEVLRPRAHWKDQNDFISTANKLVNEFHKNFEKYKEFANQEILSGAPQKITK
jgi:phosphoenolpyruvate carboxykinase (ATP)